MKNKQRIEQLEKRVQALESVVSGIKSVKIDTTIPESTLVNISTDKSLITDWLEKNGNPEIQNKIEADLALEEVKQQVTEMLKQTELPNWAEWVSVDDDGEIWHHGVKPETIRYEWDLKHNGAKIDTIDLNGADWKKCVWKISDLLGDVKKNFTTETRDKLIAFMDDLREYVHESHTDISKDERDSSEFVDIFLSKNESVDSNKMIPDTQPDWENLLSVDDVTSLASGWTNNTAYTRKINKAIHDRIKPLLERIEVGEWQLKEAEIDINQLEQLNAELKKQIADLKAKFNDELLKVIGKTVKTLQETKSELNEANKRIAELEAEKPNQIDVPFELDQWGDIKLQDDAWALYAYCKENNINQTKIERIILQMKSEEK